MVDRWTGGPLEGALFTTLAPPWEQGGQAPWEPIVLDVSGDAEDRDLALVWLVLRDLASGWLPLGFGTRRGMGAIRVERFEVQGPKGVSAIIGVRGGHITLPDPFGVVVARWNDAWREQLPGRCA